MRHGHIDHCGVCTVSAEVSLGAGAVHEKATALPGAGVGLCCTVGKRDLRSRQREISSSRYVLATESDRGEYDHRGHKQLQRTPLTGFQGAPPLCAELFPQCL